MTGFGTLYVNMYEPFVFQHDSSQDGNTVLLKVQVQQLFYAVLQQQTISTTDVWYTPYSCRYIYQLIKLLLILNSYLYVYLLLVLTEETFIFTSLPQTTTWKENGRYGRTHMIHTCITPTWYTWYIQR